jgi:hypothetical protein
MVLEGVIWDDVKGVEGTGGEESAVFADSGACLG